MFLGSIALRPEAFLTGCLFLRKSLLPLTLLAYSLFKFDNIQTLIFRERMYNLNALCLLGGLCVSSVSGLHLRHNLRHNPAAATALLSDQGVSVTVPEPTAAPADGELRRRQATAPVTLRSVLEAPDNTCGYFGGNSGSF